MPKNVQIEKELLYDLFDYGKGLRTPAGVRQDENQITASRRRPGSRPIHVLWAGLRPAGEASRRAGA